MKCDVEGCADQARIFYKGCQFCKVHGETWHMIDEYVAKTQARLRESYIRKKRLEKESGLQRLKNSSRTD